MGRDTPTPELRGANLLFGVGWGEGRGSEGEGRTRGRVSSTPVGSANALSLDIHWIVTFFFFT